MPGDLDPLLPKEHEEIGTCEGNPQRLSTRRGTTFKIWDVLTDLSIECRFPQELVGDAARALNQRVSVTGVIRYNRAGNPISIRVESLRPLRQQSELPQARDLEGINLTDGVESGEYVRRMRDAD